MLTSTPVDVFTDWLSTRPKEARMAIAIDADRLVCESGLLGRSTIVDKNGREWQVVVFRGDDLAFRLRFRKALAHPATVVVLTRGEGTDEKIDVACITDVLARNEGGDPLDLSVPAFFKQLCPKINFPALELRRHKDALLSRLEAVPTAAARIVERWGRPDDWGRGQVAAMLILARHREVSVRDLWPDETAPVDFVAHALRLLIGYPQLADERAMVQEMVREAARPQVSQHLHWLDVPPEELAAYLVLRRFVADVVLQNPSHQISGLQIFSPETALLDLEPLAPGVVAALSADTRVWAAVNALAETFLTPRRLQKVMSLLPTVEQRPESFAAATRRHGMAPVLLKQHLRAVLLSFFERPGEISLAWVPQLVDHPAMIEPVDSLSPRALECRAALQVLLALQRIEERLGLPFPPFPHADALLDWYVESAHHRLEIEVSQAFHLLETCGDDEIASAGMRYLFGGVDDLAPSPTSLKGRVRARLEALDRSLAAFVRANPEAFARGPRSALRLVKEQLGPVVEQITAGTASGRVWLLLFDGMRFDTWETVVQPLLAEHFAIAGQPCFCVLPSYTQVARTSLFAGCLPSEWRSYRGTSTKNEATLVARNLGLTQQEVKTRLRFVTEADTTRARMLMGFTDAEARQVNVLIYPISDECHEFRGDLTAFNNKIRTEILGDRTQGVRGILDDLLRRIRPDDTVLVTSDHGFIELLSPDARLVSQAEVARAGRTLQDDVRFRYVKGFRPGGAGDAIEVPGSPDPYCVAVGRSWFRREGSKNAPRYEHGGLSLAEMVVSGAVLKRVTEKAARAEIVRLPVGALVVEEDGQTELSFAVENVGNVPVEFELHAQTNLGDELLSYRGKLGARASYPARLTVIGTYRQTPARELDPAGTVTAVTLRLRHTDVQGHWRDAIDGIITIPVNVRAKKTRLDTEALKGLDDI
jgi:hypothetical protein